MMTVKAMRMRRVRYFRPSPKTECVIVMATRALINIAPPNTGSMPSALESIVQYIYSYSVFKDISTSMTRRDEATDISWESRGCCTAFAPLCQGAFGDAMIVTQRAARGKRTAFQNRVARA